MVDHLDLIESVFELSPEGSSATHHLFVPCMFMWAQSALSAASGDITVTCLALGVSKMDSDSGGGLSSGKTVRAKKKWALDDPGLFMTVLLMQCVTCMLLLARKLTLSLLCWDTRAVTGGGLSSVVRVGRLQPVKFACFRAMVWV